jgi:hypothetical protein
MLPCAQVADIARRGSAPAPIMPQPQITIPPPGPQPVLHVHQNPYTPSPSPSAGRMQRSASAELPANSSTGSNCVDLPSFLSQPLHPSVKDLVESLELSMTEDGQLPLRSRLRTRSDGGASLRGTRRPPDAMLQRQPP